MNVAADSSGSYRTYMELNGNVYIGELIRTGAPVWQNIGSVAAPNVQPSFLRANTTCVESPKSAPTF
jgi:hypothetical protein